MTATPEMPEILYDALLLIIRLVVGVSFVVASRNKFRDIGKFAKKNGLPVTVAYFVATAELFGGLGVISGILGRLAAGGLMLIMLSTISLHVFKWRSPYWAAKGGWEYDLMLFLLCAVLLIHGVGGRFSL